MKNVKPIIYEYTDYRLYLKALYEFEKTHGDFSYSTFAQRAGFQARSYLRTVITGKRNLTANAIEKVIVGFNLELSEGEAFRALVRFNQCQKFSEKHHYWDQFLKQRPKKSKSVVVDEYYYLARMAYPILLVILKQNHIKNTMEELSRLTGLSKSELQDGLQTLEKIGAVVKTGTESYSASLNNFKTHDEVPNVAVQKFHSNILEKAIEGLNLPTAKREYQSLIMALSEEEFLYLKKRVKNFMDEIEELFSGQRQKSEKVYSININLLPISPDFIREQKNQASQKSVQENMMSMASEENQL
ncbi:MAG: TIGR02147 family protein [Bdellovibrionaceae bacterium]|nr:TIGR02147 family protein [Pseudobdellovibrionaceae bacterium]NUM59649.1 TIGR02147 family protein [Pseudobdellovibrionaceae bacterium]